MYRKLTICTHVNKLRYVMQNAFEEQEHKQMTGFITCADDKHYLRPTHTHTHTHTHEEWRVYDRLGMCSRDMRQEDSSELRRQECLK